MLTKEQLENLVRNFKPNSIHILAPEAHTAWRPIIQELLERVCEGGVCPDCGDELVIYCSECDYYA